jgi:hypothetical protein
MHYAIKRTTTSRRQDVLLNDGGTAYAASEHVGRRRYSSLSGESFKSSRERVVE